MTTVYIEKENAPDLPYALVFWPNSHFPISEKRLFLRGIVEQYPTPFFALSDSPAQADFFGVPYEYFDVLDRYRPYLDVVYARARARGKKVLLFDYTDYVDRVPNVPPHAVLFRVSAYRHHKKEHEIIMPYLVADMGRSVQSHAGKPKRPTVGFCGLAAYSGVASALKAFGKRFGTRLRFFLKGDTHFLAHGKGIYWRRRALRALRRSPDVRMLSIMRSFYSLHRNAIEGEPARIRAEYIDNLRDSTLALSVRGDANASQRFYEALSASRIPLFLDTDCVLPLEEVIRYDDFMVRVPSADVARIGEYVRAFDEAHTPESFLAKEKAARRAFEDYLRLDRYFSIVFDRQTSPYKSILYGA